MEALMYVALAILVLGGLMWNAYRMLAFTDRFLKRREDAPAPGDEDDGGTGGPR